MQKIYCADLESTGLLHHLVEQGDKAKLHNFCAMSIDTEKMWTLHNKNEIEKFLDRDIILVMHNGICYDRNALKHFGFNVDRIHIVDTLALSWYLDLNREKHGLESYGEEAGVPKPEIKDWESLTQEDYDHRVQEDVKIQYYTYKKLKGMFEELYGKMSDYEFCTHRVVKYLNFKMEQLEEQQNTRFRVDVPKAKALIEKFTIEIDEKIKQLSSVMPKVPVYRKMKRPAKPFKKDGSYSATGLAWREICNEHGLDFDYDGEVKLIKGYDEPNPNSSSQIKDWLFANGWQPQTFKYERTDDGGERSIPQVYLPKSGGKICPSIEDLAEKIPEIQYLVGLSIVKHRKGSVQAFLDSLIVGDECEASAGGFTNTLRMKHRKPFVNLPSTRVIYGEDVRSCIIAKEGKQFICSDLSSMENLWKFNYQIPYDPEYVESQQSEDYDPHLGLCLEGGLLTKAQVDFFKIVDKGFPKENYEMTSELSRLLNLSDDEQQKELKRISKQRGIGKNCGYALQYSCGVKTLARTGGISEKQARVILKAYKKLNWSIDKIASAQKKKTVSHGTYQLNPFNKIWYHLKTEKDSFSTLVQGSGSYLLDMWLKHIDKLKPTDLDFDLKLVAQAHDENLQEFDDVEEYREDVKKLFDKALDICNKQLGVTIPFKCDTQFGYKYSDIH